MSCQPRSTNRPGVPIFAACSRAASVPMDSLIPVSRPVRPSRLPGPTVRREGPSVRLFTRRGHDWTDRYPAIAAAAAKLLVKSFTLDGEAVVTGADGVAVFDA
jgi:hypothetical protein